MEFIIGIDEAGRGAWAGPIVSAALIFIDTPPADIRDSKELSKSKRETIFKSLMGSTSIGIGIISSIEIDNKGIGWANRKSMEIALLDLRKKIKLPPKTRIMIDGRNIGVVSIGTNSPEYIIDGDSKVKEIAAASIIAKVTRDAIMDKLNQKHGGYGFDLHKGYGTKRHRESLLTLGPCPEHRLSYQPLKSLKA